ncbi:hypothetical protein IWQ60_001483 [Tieghemiomyces parasiticus]|uniref:SGF29 C-terminal domain-containing protein n=1 Tax=Tieghemiomyces parasiticus TaxID=78921 RepID=A0A9W8E1V4_9FUNG|nr:hypothetical protein IWQ60_001483 [Tieghemiomyces parasiticus]
MDELGNPKQLWPEVQADLNKLKKSHVETHQFMERLQDVRRQLDSVQKPSGTSEGSGSSGSSQRRSSSAVDQAQVLQTLTQVYSSGIDQAQQEQILLQSILAKVKRMQAALPSAGGSNSSREGPAHLKTNGPANGVRHNTRSVADTQLDYDSASSTTSSQNLVSAPVMVGTVVAAKTSKPKDKTEEWILAAVTQFHADKNRYEVEDVVKDESGVKPKYTLSGRNLIPLPHPVPLSPNGTTVSSTLTAQRQRALPKTSRQFQPKQSVLALYPNTTCFYRATILAHLDQDASSPNFGTYQLRFEDDGDVEHRVHHNMVLDIQRSASNKSKPY